MVFTRSLGADTDVVSKVMRTTSRADRNVETLIILQEMYSVSGSVNDPLVLRPEGTACAMRAHLSTSIASNSIHRYWYTGPMFRHERPQAGRYRQFRQAGMFLLFAATPARLESLCVAGIEAIGADSMELDVECVWLCWKVIQQSFATAGRADLASSLTMRVNSLGTDNERGGYARSLREYFASRSDLSRASSERLQAGGSALGILDSKHPEDSVAIAAAPPISEFWGPESRQRFQDTCSALAELHVPVQHDASLARGLDYYNGLCWELQSASSDSTAGTRALTLAGGGRYDGLAESMGSKHPVPAVGEFSIRCPSHSTSSTVFRLIQAGPLG